MYYSIATITRWKVMTFFVCFIYFCLFVVFFGGGVCFFLFFFQNLFSFFLSFVFLFVALIWFDIFKLGFGWKQGVLAKKIFKASALLDDECDLYYMYTAFSSRLHTHVNTNQIMPYLCLRTDTKQDVTTIKFQFIPTVKTERAKSLYDTGFYYQL